MQHRDRIVCAPPPGNSLGSWLPPSPRLSSAKSSCLLFPVCCLNASLPPPTFSGVGASAMCVGRVSSAWLGIYLNLGRQSQTEGLFVAFDLTTLRTPAHMNFFLSTLPPSPLRCYYAFSATNLPSPLVQERLLPLNHLQNWIFGGKKTTSACKMPLDK